MICAGLAVSNVTVGGITSNHSWLTRILWIWVAFWPGRCGFTCVLLRRRDRGDGIAGIRARARRGRPNAGSFTRTAEMKKGFTILPLSIYNTTMQKFHIYIETSVWSFAFAEDVPDYRADTLTFFELCRKRVFEPYVSGAVLSEIQFADVPLRKRLEELVRSVNPVMLPLLPEADGLSEAFVREKAVPPSKPEDARHVAIAMVHGLDVLVSWNFRHIVNIRREERFNAVALLEGYHHRLRIVSPKELIYI